jgi:hypothetical protein
MVDGLLPSAEVTGSVQVDRELPLEARTWGRILDLTHLEPGDLLLTRPADPSTDAVSRGIMAAQERGGFHARHAQWTHAQFIWAMTNTYVKPISNFRDIATMSRLDRPSYIAMANMP